MEEEMDWEDKYILMVVIMKDGLDLIYNKVMEDLYTATEMHTKGNFGMIKLMEREHIFQMRVMFMLENGKAINNKEKVMKSFEMDLIIKEDIKMVKNMVMGYIVGMIIVDTKDSLSKIFFMAKVHIPGVPKNIQENGIIL